VSIKAVSSLITGLGGGEEIADLQFPMQFGCRKKTWVGKRWALRIVQKLKWECSECIRTSRPFLIGRTTNVNDRRLILEHVYLELEGDVDSRSSRFKLGCEHEGNWLGTMVVTLAGFERNVCVASTLQPLFFHQIILFQSLSTSLLSPFSRGYYHPHFRAIYLACNILCHVNCCCIYYLI